MRTGDGSYTLRSARFDEPYHSLHGAVTESRNVFIDAGLKAIPHASVDVLEIGLGTGLNALLTWQGSAASGTCVRYRALEPFPVPLEVLRAVDHPLRAGMPERAEGYWRMLAAQPGRPVRLDDGFTFEVSSRTVQVLDARATFDLVYMDAFAPDRQPEMWTGDVFARLFAALRPGGLLVTYCAKGVVRRTMQHAGFNVERLPGPPGKREMLRATRPSH